MYILLNTNTAAVIAPVCPDLKRERYTHNANSSTYVRMVARAAQCVCCSRWFSEILWFSLLDKEPSTRERTQRTAANSRRTALCAQPFSCTYCCWRCECNVPVSNLDILHCTYRTFKAMSHACYINNSVPAYRFFSPYIKFLITINW